MNIPLTITCLASLWLMSLAVHADGLKIVAAENFYGGVAAQIAGIFAAKRTGELIPLCHPLPLDAVDVWSDDGRSARVSGWSVHQVAVPAGLAAAVAGADAEGWIPGIPHRVGGLDSEWLTPLTTTIVGPAGAAESRLHVH